VKTFRDNHYRRFEAECRMLEALRHKGASGNCVAKYLGAFSKGDFSHILLEYGHLSSLEDIFGSWSPPKSFEDIKDMWESFARLMSSIAANSKWVHRDPNNTDAREWHQDIKPENILLINNGCSRERPFDLAFKISDPGLCHLEQLQARQDSDHPERQSTSTKDTTRSSKPSKHNRRDTISSDIGDDGVQPADFFVPDTIINSAALVYRSNRYFDSSVTRHDRTDGEKNSPNMKQRGRLSSSKLTAMDLSMVFEPEAAVQSALASPCEEGNLSQGEDFVMVDVGGSTVDLITHQVTSDTDPLRLKEEVIKAEGLLCGTSLIEEIFSASSQISGGDTEAQAETELGVKTSVEREAANMWSVESVFTEALVWISTGYAGLQHFRQQQETGKPLERCLSSPVIADRLSWAIEEDCACTSSQLQSGRPSDLINQRVLKIIREMRTRTSSYVVDDNDFPHVESISLASSLGRKSFEDEDSSRVPKPGLDNGFMSPARGSANDLSRWAMDVSAKLHHALDEAERDYRRQRSEPISSDTTANNQG
jgi:serine/threonine protein kinase